MRWSRLPGRFSATNLSLASPHVLEIRARRSGAPSLAWLLALCLLFAAVFATSSTVRIAAPEGALPATAPGQLLAGLAADSPFPGAAQAGVADSYGKLPLAFEQNRGQTDGRVDFLARAAGHTAFFDLDGRDARPPRRRVPGCCPAA